MGKTQPLNVQGEGEERGSGGGAIYRYMHMAYTLHVLTCTCLVYLGYMYLLYNSTYVAVPLEYIQGPSITVEKHVSMGNENWATYTWGW